MPRTKKTTDSTTAHRDCPDESKVRPDANELASLEHLYKHSKMTSECYDAAQNVIYTGLSLWSGENQ